MKPFSINQRKIGTNEPCYIIAEVAQAHEGSLGLAHSFIDAAAKAGADAIKFQTHIAAAESSPQEGWRVKLQTQDKSRFDYWKRMEFSPSEWGELAKHAEEKSITFLSSPFSVEAVHLLHELGMAAWKIGSGETTNPILIDRILETKKPVILSTGMSSNREIEEWASRILKTSPLALMQCTSMYPTPAEKIGLNVIAELKEKFQIPVGLSDHSARAATGLAAVSLGANLLEVHVCFSREMFGPDASSSLTFEELTNLIKDIRWVERALKNPVNKDTLSEELKEIKTLFSKSLVATRDLSKGDKLNREVLSSRKPNIGIPASEIEKVIGLKLKRNIGAGDFLKLEDLEA